MPNSVFEPAVQSVIDQARTGQGNLFPSPEDWRDAPIYFLCWIGSTAPWTPPRHLPFDALFGYFQGGNFEGVRSNLQYIKDMGFGAIWLSPVLKNPAFDDSAYHGYGIQNFLAIEPRFASAPGREELELRRLVAAASTRSVCTLFSISYCTIREIYSSTRCSRIAASLATDSIDWQNTVQPIRWRDAAGHADPAASEAPPSPTLDAAIWPSELCHNAIFTRRGNLLSSGGQPDGDFSSLKGISFNDFGPDLHPAQDVLIRAYQYIIAKFDIDGFRIDTLKFIPPEFERTFANAMREFGLSAGKKNFFTFGEVYDDESEISQFIGRNTTATGEVVGVDAALDYPLFFKLPSMIKGLGPTPADIANVFENRKRVEANILTSHGEAGQYFVTFLDNHDQSQRFGYTGPTQLTNQIILGLGLLFGLPGVPCVYYGTEQGLSGHKTATETDDSMVREALWGKVGSNGQATGFDTNHPMYLALQTIGQVRSSQPALRYGRYYFRPLSGDGTNFGLSTFPTGVLAFSRILNDQEVIIVANTIPEGDFSGEVVVDFNINGANPAYRVLYSNQSDSGAIAGRVVLKPQGSVAIHEVDGSITNGPARTLPIRVASQEIQILSL